MATYYIAHVFWLMDPLKFYSNTVCSKKGIRAQFHSTAKQKKIVYYKHLISRFCLVTRRTFIQIVCTLAGSLFYIAWQLYEIGPSGSPKVYVVFKGTMMNTSAVLSLTLEPFSAVFF